jgi:hypothetical protein
MSHVNSRSRHERLNFESIRAFQRVSHWTNEETPIILETPVESAEVDEEITAAARVFATCDSAMHKIVHEKLTASTAQHVAARTVEAE